MLDFGLAKVFGGEVAGAARSESPTITRDATAAGVIMGTAAYMSPEQARGKPLDKRTDIWSLGCCLYEALSGRPAFLGETVSDTLAKIIQSEPDWEALPRATPERVRDLIARCLVKDAENRLRDIGDARIDMARALSEPSEASSQKAARTSRATILAVAAAVAAASLTLWSVTRSPAPAARPVMRSILPMPDASSFRINFGSPYVAISPNGRHVAYVVVDGEEGRRRLYLQALENLEGSVIDEGNMGVPFFSPDSQWLIFEKDRRPMKISFRALVQSNRFERAWTLLAHTYKAEVTTLDNVVPIRSWQ